MKKLILFILLTVSFGCHFLLAQNEIFTINSTYKVYDKEFDSQILELQKLGYQITDIDDYYSRFVEYKLRVFDSRQNNLDKNGDFKQQMDYYKNLVINKKIANSKKAKKYISFMQNDCINEYKLLLFRVDNCANGDTLCAYNMAKNYASMISENNESFKNIANKYSDEPSSIVNRGDIGYVSVENMPCKKVAEFAKYGQKNQISTPLYGKNGYYLVKVLDVRPRIDSITLSYVEERKSRRWQYNDSIKKRVNNIYDELKNGKNINQYSKNTAIKFSYHEALEKFGSSIDELKNINDFSKVIEYNNHYYIIKLDNIDNYVLTQNRKYKIESDFYKTDYFLELKNNYLDSIKKTIKVEKLSEVSTLFNYLKDSLVFDAKFKVESLEYEHDPLVRIDQKTYSKSDFLNYIYLSQQEQKAINIKSYLDQKYKSFVDEKLYSLVIDKAVKSDNQLLENLKEIDNILMSDLFLVNNNVNTITFDSIANGPTIKCKVYSYLLEDTHKKAIKLLNKDKSADLCLYLGKNNISLEKEGTYNYGQDALLDKIIDSKNNSTGIYEDLQAHKLVIYSIIEPQIEENDANDIYSKLKKKYNLAENKENIKEMLNKYRN